MNLDIEREFPQDEDLVYLNHAAVAPWPARAARAVTAFAEENARRGAAAYAEWNAREARLREQLAELVNARSVEEIALAKNTSEALSFIAAGLDWQPGDNVVTSDEEFPSNRMVWEALAPRGVALREVALRPGDGTAPEAALENACDARTRLLSISSIQYASGVHVDLERLGRFCAERGIRFCVDAIQSVGAVRVDVQACHADFLVADGHKWMLGPEGLALFFVRRERLEDLALFEYGWHMTDAPGDYDRRSWRPAPHARRFECGSPNMLGAVALSASLALLLEAGAAEVESGVLARSRHIAGHIEAMPGVHLISPPPAALRSGIVTFRPAHGDARALQRSLRERGVICAHRGGGVRLSPHFYTPFQRIDRALELVEELLALPSTDRSAG